MRSARPEWARSGGRKKRRPTDRKQRAKDRALKMQAGIIGQVSPSADYGIDVR